MMRIYFLLLWNPLIGRLLDENLSHKCLSFSANHLVTSVVRVGHVEGV